MDQARMRPRHGFVVLLWLSGCEEPISAKDLYLAEGSLWTVDPDSLCVNLDCGYDKVTEIQDVFAEASGVVEIAEIGPTTFVLEALETGDAQITVIGLDSDDDAIERYARARVRPVSRFDFAMQCDVSEPSEDPWLLPSASEVFVEWGMWDSDDHALAGEPDFELGEIVASEEDLIEQDAVWTLPEDLGSTEISSPLTDDAVATIEVHAVGEFDGFEAQWWPDSTFEIGDVKQISTSMLIDGRRVCQDTEERLAEVLTSDSCSFAQNELVLEIEQNAPTVRVFGLTEGVCNVRVFVPDHGYAETLTVEITQPTVDPEGE